MDRRVALAIGMVVVTVLASPSVAVAADAPRGDWVRPVGGEVVRAFVAPDGPYARGHRGVDLAARSGESVRAIGDGEVVFAGRVASANHVVVLHDNGWRTSISYVEAIMVGEGQRVRAGDRIAMCCSADPAHRERIHVGLRIGDDYVDPMRLFIPLALTVLVRLAPPRGDEWPSSRRSAIDLVLDTTGVSTLVGWGGEVIGVARVALDVFGGVLAAGADELPEVLRYLDELDPSPVGLNAMFDVGEGLLDWVDQLDECDRHPPEPGTIAQSNQLMFVAGIDSRTRRDGSTNGFPATDVGYAAEDVHWYSYAADGGPYDRHDTYASIETAAARLGAQLRAMQQGSPGRSVDLVAHSQGGVVVQTFLKYHYDPADPTLPPIGTVVTLSSPHAGAPVATTGAALGRFGWGDAVLDLVPAPPHDAQSVQDLAETSELQRRLAARRLPPGLEVVSIGTPYDWAVPSSATALDGAEAMTVNPDGLLEQHTAMTTDRATQYVVNNALLGRPAPCVSLPTSLAAAFVPERIAWIERTPGNLARSWP